MKIEYQAKFYALNQKIQSLKQETDDLQGKLNEKNRVLNEDHHRSKKEMIQKLDAELHMLKD